jgi:hypothetical protein
MERFKFEPGLPFVLKLFWFVSFLGLLGSERRTSCLLSRLSTT